MGQAVSQEGIMATTDGAVFVFTSPQLQRLHQQLASVKELFEGIIQQALPDKIQLRNSLLGEEATTRYLKFVAQYPVWPQENNGQGKQYIMQF